MAPKTCKAKLLDACGYVAPALLSVAAVASFNAAQKNGYAPKHLVSQVDSFESDNLLHNWGCSVEVADATWPSRGLHGTFLLTSLLPVVLAAFMVCSKDNRPRKIRFWRALRLVRVFTFMQLAYLTAVVKNERPTFHFNSSLLESDNPISPESKELLRTYISTFSHDYSYFTDFNHALSASWIAWGLLLVASACSLANLRDKGVQLPATNDDVVFEAQNDVKEIA